MDTQKLKTISETSKMLGISIDTLRRWDKSGKFPSIRKPRGHRYYNSKDIEEYLANINLAKKDLFVIANYWASKKEGTEPDNSFYCPNSFIFQSKIMKLEKNLSGIEEFKNMFSLIVAIAGEIGNNSFDHNIGNWPDIPGIFFGYDLFKKQIVLADRGQGILKTLQRVRPDLKNDTEALRMAFTEVISGRTPEARGNGLKFVRSVVSNNDISLYFKTGTAEVEINQGNKELKIKPASNYIRGCIALIKF